MFYIIIIIVFCLCYYLRYKKYINPYKLIMVFGKKGSGKSTFLVKKAIEYHKKGFLVYTNMEDICLPYARIINPEEIGNFVPPADSVLLLDECGILYDNRNFRSFKPETRDFYKYQRHYKVVCYLASQAFDVDLKLRNLCDSMILIQNIGIVYALVRPITKKWTLTEATAEGESKISENLRFTSVLSWKLFKVTRYARYFESYKTPEKPLLPYKIPENPIEQKNKRRKKKSTQ